VLGVGNVGSLQLKWENPIASVTLNTGSSPTVVNGVVYVGSGPYGTNAVYIGSEDNNVYALNASTGAKLWSYTTGSVVNSSPAVANGVGYVSTGGGNVYALNASTGALLWSYATGALSTLSPTIVDGVVYIPAGFSVYAFGLGVAGTADLFLRIRPTTTTVHQGDLLTYAFPVWNLGPSDADQEVLNTQVPAGTVFDYIRISGTPGLGTCTHTPYLGAGPIPIVCHENASMALNTTGRCD
jgi:hypothetical protein